VGARPVKYSMSSASRIWVPAVVAMLGGWHLTASGQAAPQSPSPVTCAIAGIVTSGGIPLPGVALSAAAGEGAAASSTDVEGAFRLRVSPGGTVTLRAELTGFAALERAVVLPAQPPCDTRVDLEMTLASRSPSPAPTAGAMAPAGRGRAGGPGRGQAGRFASLALEPDAAAQAAAPPDDPDDIEAVRQLLPPGFSTDAAAEAVALTGSQGQVDRGMLNERMGAIMRGEFNELDPGMRPGGRGGPGGGPPGAFAEQLGRFGPGEGGFGGRMGGAGRLQGSVTYTIGGSPLNASPFALRGEEREEDDYLSQRFGATLGGPVKIPGVYDGTRRTSFTFSYTGNRSDEIFDSYSTVPGEALRRGDFSSLLAAGTVIRDPATGEPFPGNRIPESRIDEAAASLLRFIPLPNLEGDARNFRHTTPQSNVTDNVTVRLTHNFNPPPAARGRGAQRVPGQPAAGPAGRGQGGRGGRGAQGTSVVLNASVSYRRNEGDRFTAFPTVSGANRGSTISVPLGLNIRAGRMVHTARATFGRTTSRASNTFAFVEDVAGNAGIRGIATDPFAWGVPSLSFSTFSALRDIAPSRRDDRRLDAGYTWMLPRGRHTFRAGADYHQTWSRSQTDSNPRGTFVFTGFYTGGPGLSRGSALDFADFLLGLPQQASVQFGPGAIELRGRAFSLFAQDDWRVSNTVTINAGLRYEFVAPFEEAGGRMVNLDVADGFSAAVPVQSGQTGPFSGAFPFALVRSDRNNLAPRIGAAWRIARGSVLRAGYGINYNAGSYASIARQLIAQPPFAVTNTSIGTSGSPLSLTDPFAQVLPATTTNNYGIDPDYELGIAQVWNADYGRDLPWALNAGIGYNGTRGTHLDMLRAPNRDATGLRIEGVQPFLWQTSEGRSTLHAVSLRLRKRTTRGIGGGATYTWTRARDNASSFGGAGGTVAQDDRNLDAEWGRSSFERQHRATADATFELPFGRNRRWLSEGGALAALAGNWTLSANFAYDSGQPYTARVLGAASEIARGTNGSLRADYVGGNINVANPTVDQFFNVAAFRIPAPGQFGTAERNSIIGPPSHQLNAALARDVTLGGTRALTVRVDASNVLNRPIWGTIDTVVNSPTFGQVLSVRSMRTVGVNVRFRF
jgi:trimeric autotransporter adhesin